MNSKFIDPLLYCMCGVSYILKTRYLQIISNTAQTVECVTCFADIIDETDSF